MEDNQYSKMQRDYYNREASQWSLRHKDPVIGNYQAHLAYDDVADLFNHMDLSDKIGLDFGCGPGRNLVRLGRSFKRLDGVDISEVCLSKAALNLESEGFDCTALKLYHTNGVDLRQIPADEYDVVMSTITLQHICVYDIRFSLMREIYRVLKIGGVFTAQMGFGHREGGHPYHANSYDVQGTNGWNDVMVTDANDLEVDLCTIGFEDFNHKIAPVRGGDVHDNWIYFSARRT